MKNPDEAKRWLSQAEFELEIALWDLKGGKYSAVCFWAQQSAEKAMKAYLYEQKRESIFEHSVSALVAISIKFDKDFKAVEKKANSLDRFYIPTRYPNGLPYPAIPAKSYTKDDAKQAIEIATEIVNLVKGKLYGRV